MSKQSDNAEIAVLQNEMKQVNLTLHEQNKTMSDIKKDTTTIMTTLAALPVNYYTKEEVDKKLKDRRTGIIIMQIFTILMTVAITYLATYFFTHIGG